LAIVIHLQQFDQSNVCSGPDRSSPPKLIVKMFLMPGEDLAEAKRQRYGDATSSRQSGAATRMMLKIASIETIFGDHRKTRLGRPRHRITLKHGRLEERLVPGLERLRVSAGCRVLPDCLHGVVQRLCEGER